MPRTRHGKRGADKKAGSAAAADPHCDATVSTSSPSSDLHSQELQLRNVLRMIEEEEQRLRQRLADDLAGQDRALAIVLAQVPEEDLNQPPASDAKLSLSADFVSNKKLVSSTAFKPGPASSKRVASEEGVKETKKMAVGKGAAASAAKAVAIVAKGAAGSKTVPAKKAAAKAPIAAPSVKSVPAKAAAAKASAASSHESRPRGRPSRVTRQSSRRDITPSSAPSDADGVSLLRPRTRSISRSSSSMSVLYQTPRHNSTSSMMHSLAVTPKVDPYGPISLKRQPRHGEMALSMSGSPLMVNVNTQEPNIAVPINDEVYCIMATEGPVPAIGGIDEATKAKLKTLRANLNQILGDS